MDAFDDQRVLLTADTPRVILDLGANVGATAMRYAKLFPGATVHAFEPFPETYLRLRTAVGNAKNVQTHALAIADASGTRTFFFNQGHTTNSLLPVAESYNETLSNSDETKPVGQVEVPTSTVDAFCELQGISHVDVLKMDIQGGELMALRGAANMLGRDIDLIYSEVNFSKIYEGQASFHELCELLTGYGYILLELYPLNYARNGAANWTDAIWINPQLAARLNG